MLSARNAIQHLIAVHFTEVSMCSSPSSSSGSSGERRAFKRPRKHNKNNQKQLKQLKLGPAGNCKLCVLHLFAINKLPMATVLPACCKHLGALSPSPRHQVGLPISQQHTLAWWGLQTRKPCPKYCLADLVCHLNDKDSCKMIGHVTETS